jgi:hypothetical protein
MDQEEKSKLNQRYKISIGSEKQSLLKVIISVTLTTHPI